MFQHFQGLFGRWPFRADFPAQCVEPLYRVKVISVGTDAPHTGDGLPAFRQDADNQIVGQGSHLRGVPVGGEHMPDGFLHPVGLRPAEGYLIGKVRCKVQ